MKYSELASFWITLLLICCSAFSPFKTVICQTTTVDVKPPNVSAHLGNPFNVTVSLSNVQNLYGIEIILRWNPDVLRVTTVNVRLGVETFSDGVLHESDSSPPLFIAENNITETGDEYKLVATSMNPAPSFSGSGNIVILIFDPLSLGDSALELESQLFDYPPLDRDPRISFSIDHTSLDSVITVYDSTSTPTPTTSTSTPTTNPSTPTPTISPTLTPSSSPEPPILILKIEYILAILIIIITILSVYFYLGRRK